MIYFENRDFVNHFRQTIHRHEIGSVQDRPHRFISVCIVCMNRLEDLKQTLPQNLMNSESYQEVEFVVLDYNSNDGLGEWIGDNLSDYILRGRLNYYRSTDPQYYVPCHSKNAVALLGKGDIIVNVDADNFVPEGYLHALNDCFEPETKIVAVSSDFLRIPERLMLKGRVAFYRKDFLDLGGYDEDLDCGWGSDDMHLVFRSIMSGFKVSRFDSSFVNHRIDTSNQKRISNMVNRNIEELGSINAKLVSVKLARRENVANINKPWGQLSVTKNDLIMLRSSRQYLKQVILPLLAFHQPVLDVGIRSYNKHHKTYFDDYVSVDIQDRGVSFVADVTDPKFRGQALSKFPSYGSVLFNGMIGYGINTKDDLEKSLTNFREILRPHGLLVIGWNENLMSRSTLMNLAERHFKIVLMDGNLVHDTHDVECHNFMMCEKSDE